MGSLKPCPFCGKPVTIYYSSVDNNYFAVHLDEQHSECIVEMPLNINHKSIFLCLESAYAAWNRRAGDG